MIKWIKDVARSLFYDDQVVPTDLGDNVQDAIDNLFQNAQVAASPGFTFGRSGRVTPNTWYSNEGVPSNKAGHTVNLNNAVLESISISNEDVSTFEIEVYEHEGDETNLTLLTTVNVSSSRTGTFFVDVPVTTGRQLAAKQSSGTAKNAIVDLIIKGNLS